MDSIYQPNGMLPTPVLIVIAVLVIAGFMWIATNGFEYHPPWRPSRDDEDDDDFDDDDLDDDDERENNYFRPGPPRQRHDSRTERYYEIAAHTSDGPAGQASLVMTRNYTARKYQPQSPAKRRFWITTFNRECR